MRRGSGNFGVERSDTPCEGSIVVRGGLGVDCFFWDLYDATTGAWQASGGGCLWVPGQCVASVPGFVVPTRCFDLAFSTSSPNLCTTDGGSGPDGGVDLPTMKKHGCTPGGNDCSAGESCTIAHGCCQGVGSDCSVDYVYPGSGAVDRQVPCSNDDMCLSYEYCQAATKCCPAGYICNLSTDGGGDG